MSALYEWANLMSEFMAAATFWKVFAASLSSLLKNPAVAMWSSGYLLNWLTYNTVRDGKMLAFMNYAQQHLLGFIIIYWYLPTFKGIYRRWQITPIILFSISKSQLSWKAIKYPITTDLSHLSSVIKIMLVVRIVCTNLKLKLQQSNHSLQLSIWWNQRIFLIVET